MFRKPIFLAQRRLFFAQINPAASVGALQERLERRSTLVSVPYLNYKRSPMNTICECVRASGCWETPVECAVVAAWWYIFTKGSYGFKSRKLRDESFDRQLIRRCDVRSTMLLEISKMAKLGFYENKKQESEYFKLSCQNCSFT